MFWDILGNIQKFFNNDNNAKSTQQPYNTDKKLNFGVTLDAAKNLPYNPTSYANYSEKANAWVENARQTSLNAVGSVMGKPSGIAAGGALGIVGGPGGAVAGATLGATAWGVAELDKKTNNSFGKVLVAGTGNARSNYAFINDLSRKDAGMGFMATLGIIAGGTIGAVGGFAAGLATSGGIVAVPFAIAGAKIGSAAAGKAERSFAKSGMFDSLNKNIKQSAILSESAVGQEQYNIGRDAVRIASHISPWKSLGDTSKGVGAVTSGIVNFVFEVGVAPDIAAVKGAGAAIKGAVSGGVVAKLSGPVEQTLGRLSGEKDRQALRADATITMHKATAAGEQTRLTQVYKFNQESNAITIQQHSSLKGTEEGQIAGALLAGKDFETQSLIYRIGYGDKSARAELAIKSPATHAELQRYEGVIEFVEKAGSSKAVTTFHSVTQGKTLSVSEKNKINKKILDDEIQDIRSQKTWLDNSLKLDSALLDKTVSVSKFIEGKKIEAAKGRVARGLDVTKADMALLKPGLSLIEREVASGKIMQSFYQKNGLSVVVRFVHRKLDDAPHQTINYNDMLQSNSRVRTTARMGVNRKILSQQEAIQFTDDFAKAFNEGEKNLLIEAFNKKIISNLADKYNVPVTLKDNIVAEYLSMTKENVAKAKDAKSNNRAYLVDDVNGSGEIIRDPQLISQLAQGNYLPDIKLIESAMKKWNAKERPLTGIGSELFYSGRSALNGFESLWRSFTLARIGFPINIFRDTTIRAYGDGVLFGVIKQLSKDAIDSITNSSNTVSRIKKRTEARINPAKNLKIIRNEITQYEAVIKAAQELLDDAGYIASKPPKNPSMEITKHLSYLNTAKAELNAHRLVRDAVESGIATPVVSRKTLIIDGIPGFQRYDGGPQGQKMLEIIRGKDTLRALLSSSRELGVSNVRKDRDGGVSLAAVENEAAHMASWVGGLTNQLANDPVAMKIMTGMKEKEVIDWIASHESGSYLERFGFDKELGRNLRTSDARYVYNRVVNVVANIAPDAAIQNLVVSGTVTAAALKKLYPDLTKRPNIISDLNKDLLGQSNLAVKSTKKLKEIVTWLATVPPSKLAYNPYFNYRYQEKLQGMVAIANSQGRRLTAMDQRYFESTARAYALNQLQSKIVAFSRDMNYPEAFNHAFAFFPAIVEQYRAYGKIMLDHPEFPYKIATIMQIPEYIGDVKLDAYGDEYIEVGLPLLGLNGRLPKSWFNPLNPTGGQMLSPSALGSSALNEFSKKVNFEGKIADWLLPFGTTANYYEPLLPSTIRRITQVFQAKFSEDAPQFNKDVNMFMQKAHADFIAENEKDPTGRDIAEFESEARNDALSLSFLRALGAGILPLQPKYVTPLQVYSDLFKKYTEQYGSEGSDRFIEDYPDYFMLTNSLSDSTSGIRPNDTAVALVKKHPDVIRKIMADMGKGGNVAALGAIFNDENYAFSSSAQAYLVTHKIPGAAERFIEQGAALENTRSAIVNNGWREYSKMIDITSEALRSKNYDPGSGYGASVLTLVKDAFVAKMQTDNNLWYEEKQGTGFKNKLPDTISALTTAVNTPAMWQDLAKQDRWHTIVEYLNFRYDVHDLLEYRRTGIDASGARDIKLATEAKVAELRSRDIEFGKFYDRYLSNDDFKYIVQGGQ